jgi:hypothetical protein
MPAAHRAHLEWTPQRLIEWGRQIGMAYRSCTAVLSPISTKHSLRSSKSPARS